MLIIKQYVLLLINSWWIGVDLKGENAEVTVCNYLKDLDMMTYVCNPGIRDRDESHLQE